MSSPVHYPFQNIHLSLEDRVKDLVSRLTLEEKIQLMPQYQTAVERLGIQDYKHGTEAAHGIAWLGEATVFPQPIGLACTWNKELLEKVGSAIGDEARAFYRRNPHLHGLTLWSPTIDMERDPRWGRTEEAFGEDPYLTGHLAAALIRGMQGDHPVYLKTAATLKHFLGNNNEVDRGHCSANIDERNMREYYLKPFEIAFKEGKAQSMMTAYNSINDIPAILHPYVHKVVKEEWGMDGFIVSDAADMTGLVRDHHYCDTYAEAVALSIKNGIDSITDEASVVCKAIEEALEQGLLVESDLDNALMNTFRVRFRLGEFDSEELNPYASIPDEVIACREHSALSLEAARQSIVLLKNENGMLPLKKDRLKEVAVIGPLADVVYRDWYSGTLPYKVTPLQGIIHKLGQQAVNYHSGNDEVYFTSCANERVIGIGEERKLLAQEGLSGEEALFSVTDWGWGSYTLQSQLNGKYWTGDEQITVTADEAYGWYVKECFHLEELSNTTYSLKTWNGKRISAGEGGACPLQAVDQQAVTASERFVMHVTASGIEQAVETARNADTAIVFVGNNPMINGKEEVDRQDIALAQAQEKLVRAVYEANPNTIVVVIGSYPIALNWAEDHVPAILYSAHSGQELGNAIADVLFGDYSPAGRLNMTWYRSTRQLPPIKDYDIIKGRRTYMYFDGEPLYPFGHGLTYTEFKYSELQLSSKTISGTGQLQLDVQVENVGVLASDEVVQLYIRANQSSVVRPLKQLCGFARIHLAPAEKQRVSFQVDMKDLAFWDEGKSEYCVEAGDYTVMVGRSFEDIVLVATFQIV